MSTKRIASPLAVALAALPRWAMPAVEAMRVITGEW